MSYSYEATGYFVEQRGEQGQFVEGDVLPVALPDLAALAVESQNDGAADVVKEAYTLARLMIANERFGDTSVGRFKILINGHVQSPADANSSKHYLQTRIEAL
jgi:hypothetical protein